jgi:hypothetical protein
MMWALGRVPRMPDPPPPAGGYNLRRFQAPKPMKGEHMDRYLERLAAAFEDWANSR